jgi:hypothetical protein
MEERTFWETIKAGGDQVMKTVEKVVHEGNVRRVVVKQGDRSVAEFPLTVGVVGTVFAPVLAAIGALTALLTDCTIEVERVQAAAPPPEPPEPPAGEAPQPPQS